MIDKMMIRGAKVHNLKYIDVDVSLDKQASKASVDKVLYVPAALALHQRPAVKEAYSLQSKEIQSGGRT